VLIADKIFNYFYVSQKNFFYFWRDFLGFFFIKLYLIINIILNVILWYGAYWLVKKLPAALVALHYNIDFGINLIGEARNIYIIAVSGSIVFLVNLFLSALLLKREEGKIIAHLLMSLSIVIHFYLAAGLFSLYLVNFLK
jgi:hypothetical protein